MCTSIVMYYVCAYVHMRIFTLVYTYTCRCLYIPSYLAQKPVTSTCWARIYYPHAHLDDRRARPIVARLCL